MKEYICSVCGYVHKTDGELPDDFKCPICGAGKDAFKLKEDAADRTESNLEKPHFEKELSPMEMSIICSNLSRGCEKQYMSKESENFRKLAEFFRSKAEPVSEVSTEKLLELLTIMLDCFYGHNLSHVGSTGRVTYHACTSADKNYRGVSELLHIHHNDNLHEVTHMETVGSGVESDIELNLLPAQELPDSLLVSCLLYESPFLQNVIHVVMFTYVIWD